MHIYIFAGAEFASKRSYLSGDFHMRIKFPPRDSAGLVTAFYVPTYITSTIYVCVCIYNMHACSFITMH